MASRGQVNPNATHAVRAARKAAKDGGRTKKETKNPNLRKISKRRMEKEVAAIRKGK